MPTLHVHKDKHLFDVQNLELILDYITLIYIITNFLKRLYSIVMF